MYKLYKTKSKFKISGDVPIINYQINVGGNTVNIINQLIIDRVVESKYSKNFNNLMKKILEYLDDDDSDSSTALLYLDELSRLRDMLINKYVRYISPELKSKFMKNIRLLAHELKKKVKNLTKSIKIHTR